MWAKMTLSPLVKNQEIIQRSDALTILAFQT